MNPAGHQFLHSGFLRSAGVFPDRPAIRVGGATFTYEALRARAASLAATIGSRTADGGVPLTAVFAHRSATAFAGILGALLSGHGYVPLNPTFPTARTRGMLETAGCRSLIVDSAAEAQLEALVGHCADSLLVLIPDRDDVTELRRRLPQHIVLGAGDLDPAEAWAGRPNTPDAVAYLLFTSGSTGIPKGVMVSHRNAVHFVENIAARYGITEEDRFSQTFDMTFDLSVFDMFVAWHRGACVCCPSAKTLLNPDGFIREMDLTVWLSVPTLAQFMRRLGGVKKGAYPSLRWSLFCGEPLPVGLAAAWAEAAPNAVLENLYGPTEVTVACAAYRWDAERSPAQCEAGTVPIGAPLPGMTALVVDEQLGEVPPGATGELLLSGPQVTPGYWRNSEATARAYVTIDGRPGVFYRTGDRVRRPARPFEPLTYIGRTDHQVKVLGYRVELGEVEATLREQPGVSAAVAVGWPLTPSGPAAIVAFLTGDGIDPARVRSAVAATLQPYAVPRAIHVLPALPVGTSGKVDRQALLASLDV